MIRTDQSEPFDVCNGIELFPEILKRIAILSPLALSTPLHKNLGEWCEGFIG